MMAKKAVRSTGRGSDQFVLRLPEGMRDQVAAAAEQTGMSMNAVIVKALALHLKIVGDDLSDQVSQLWTKVEALESAVADLREEMHPSFDPSD
ncbi:Arc family DNA-binding protein [Bradyrhizobium sp. GCM10023182]|uniref:Arc family DNA-binding protein n=1 Tax=Bradyrhizobium zhengyangense TaxID=2911009 RepID=A0ABS9M245_9BRAD|nr:Arc family DNA-binding protein [Bradyrhizobium zhengyangense]MCG2673341.1 Arc family DNA-binding protein [Bradyrhizobium zhengyangense]